MKNAWHIAYCKYTDVRLWGCCKACCLYRISCIFTGIYDIPYSKWLLRRPLFSFHRKLHSYEIKNALRGSHCSGQEDVARNDRETADIRWRRRREEEWILWQNRKENSLKIIPGRNRADRIHILFSWHLPTWFSSIQNMQSCRRMCCHIRIFFMFFMRTECILQFLFFEKEGILYPKMRLRAKKWRYFLWKVRCRQI